MPKITTEQARGDAGERWFVAQLPKGWFFQKPSMDLGVDGIVVVTEPGILNGLEFRVQIKTSKKFAQRGGKVVIQGLKMDTVRYWFANPAPLLLVAVDDSSNVAYFGWHDDAISDPRGQFSSGRSTLSAHIDVDNVLSLDGWDSIRKRLQEHYTAILQAFYASEVSGFLVPTIHELATEVKYLFYVHSAKYWGKEERIAAEVERAEKTLLLLDVRTHLDVLRTLESLHSRLERFPRQQSSISNFMEGYRDAWQPSWPIQGAPKDLPPDQEVGVDPERMRLVRPMLIDGLLDVIQTLSQPAKATSEDDKNPSSQP